MADRPKPHFVGKSSFECPHSYGLMEEISLTFTHQDITSVHWQCFFRRRIHPAPQVIIALPFPYKLNKTLPLQCFPQFFFAAIGTRRIIRYSAPDTYRMNTSL